jgi:HAD superfamily hydrolase (TIGR01509 family)
MTEEKTFEGLISDLVGVYSTDGTARFMEALQTRYGLSPNAASLFAAIRKNATTTHTSADEVLTQFLSQLEQFAEESQRQWNTRYSVEDLQRTWLSLYEPNRALVDLYDRLRSTGFRIALLTNNVAGIVERFDWRLAEMLDDEGLSSHFDSLVTSYASGHRKPDEQIFMEVVGKLGLPASGIICVDDKEENLAAARTLGMECLLYVNPQKLESDLRSLHLQFPTRGLELPRPITP